MANDTHSFFFQTVHILPIFTCRLQRIPMQLESSPWGNTVGVDDEIKSYHGVSRAPDGSIFWKNVSTNSWMKDVTS